VLLSNRSFDTDTQRHCAARRAGQHTLGSAMPLRAGLLEGWTDKKRWPGCRNVSACRARKSSLLPLRGVSGVPV
jgi:hypothetical protein